MTRHEAREQAFFVLFEKIFNDDFTISQIIENAQDADLIKINSFAEKTLKIAEDNAENIDALISEHSKQWSIERLPKVSLAVLRLAVGEIKFNDEVPESVSVNEAVELAKTYGTAEDASFVNGLLSSILKAR